MCRALFSPIFVLLATFVAVVYIAVQTGLSDAKCRVQTVPGYTDFHYVEMGEKSFCAVGYLPFLTVRRCKKRQTIWTESYDCLLERDLLIVRSKEFRKFEDSVGLTIFVLFLLAFYTW